ncbi:hypothetical protein BX070DRAFT_251673 [Coemansia spiralis]|nr:hypothetical protein BX070DRAFT_251673 [Coemansia spiralis]
MRDLVSALPPEIVLMIFRRLALQKITQCMSVSRKWYQLLDNSAVLWSIIDIRSGMYKEEHSKEWKSLVPSLGEHHSSERVFDMINDHSTVGEFDDASIVAIIRRAGPALSKLSLDFMPQLSGSMTSALIRHKCTNIRHLELRANRKISSEALEMAVYNASARLEFLALSATEIDDLFVQTLFSCAPNLTHLDISFCRKVTKNAFPFVVDQFRVVFTPPSNSDASELAKRKSLLRETALSNNTDDPIYLEPYSPLSTQEITHQDQLPNLQVLLVTGCSGIDNAAVARITHVFGDTLHTLNVSQSAVGIDVLQAISMTTWVSHLLHKKPLRLRTLEMCDIDFRTGLNTLRHIVVPEGENNPQHVWRFVDFTLAVPNLTSIAIGGHNSFVTDDFVMQIAQVYRNLRSIDLHRSLRLHNIGLAALGENCPYLEHLDISGCRGCDDQGVVAFVRGSTALKSLVLCELTITDESMAAIGNRLRHLEQLCVDTCDRLTAQGIRAVVNRCRATLKTLSFNQSAIDDTTVVAWCRAQLQPGATVTASTLQSINGMSVFQPL